MTAIGILLRFPFYLLRVIIVLPLALLFNVLMWVWAPLYFVACAFKNDQDNWNQYKEQMSWSWTTRSVFASANKWLRWG